MLGSFTRSYFRHEVAWRAVVACSAVLAWSAPVGAHLGSDAAGVQSDSLALRGALSTSTLVSYDVQQIAAAGQTVREYLTRGGRVFAVTWSGPTPPDLSQLLGLYFPEYAGRLAALEHPGLKRSLRVVTPTLIVESSGHMRAFSGRAYLPALLPPGVPPAAIR